MPGLAQIATHGCCFTGGGHSLFTFARLTRSDRGLAAAQGVDPGKLESLVYERGMR